MLAAAQRLAALDLADIGGVPQDDSGTASLIALWASPERRTQSLARLELLLNASRSPALRFMQEARAKFIERISRSDKRRSGTPAARVNAIALVALVDGLTLKGLLSGKLTRSEVAQILQRLER